MEITSIEDLAYAYENNLYGRISIESFEEKALITLLIEETTKVGKRMVIKDRMQQTRLYQTRYDGTQFYLIAYKSASMDNKDSDNAYIKINVIDDFRYSGTLPFDVSGDDYVISYQTYTGTMILNGFIFIGISIVGGLIVGWMKVKRKDT